jgi:hypothetical protein
MSRDEDQPLVVVNGVECGHGEEGMAVALWAMLGGAGPLPTEEQRELQALREQFGGAL